MDGEILFITHAALMLLPYFHRRQDWHVIMDEVPQADWCAEFSVADTHRLITDCFDVDTEAASLADNRYVRAVPKDYAALERMARNKNCDQVWDIFQQFSNVLISPHWSAYVLDDQYTNLIKGVGERRKLLAFAHLKPSLLDGFAVGDDHGCLLPAVGPLSAMEWNRRAVPTAQGRSRRGCATRSTATDTCSPSCMPPRKIGRRTSATRHSPMA